MIRKLVKYFLGAKNRRLLKKHACISPMAINTGVKIRLDDPDDDRIYLKIGDNSIVSGRFIFESREGCVEIGCGCYVGGGEFISRSSINIGNHVTIAWGVMIYDHNSHPLDSSLRRSDLKIVRNNLRCGIRQNQGKDWSVVKSRAIKICDDVWIGMNATILKGVTIGEGAVVAACSVVTKDVPAWSVVAGNPAKVVKYLK